jgi:hypothetical protein
MRAFRLISALLLCGPATVSFAVELKQQTLDAYHKYVRITESRIAADLAQNNHLTWLDRLPADRRHSAEARLRNGDILIETLETRDNGGREIDIPDGTVHHWVGGVLIRGATVQAALRLVEDYDHHDVTYRPNVIKSKLIERNGPDFKVFLRFYKKKVVTVVLNNTFVVHYETVDPNRVWSRSRAVKIGEVVDASNPDGPERPFGRDHGYLWGSDSFWRFQQQDGGVYIEMETITLTRDIPTGFGWIVGPIVKSLPREAVTDTLGATRAALTKQAPDRGSM